VSHLRMEREAACMVMATLLTPVRQWRLKCMRDYLATTYRKEKANRHHFARKYTAVSATYRLPGLPLQEMRLKYSYARDQWPMATCILDWQPGSNTLHAWSVVKKCRENLRLDFIWPLRPILNVFCRLRASILPQHCIRQVFALHLTG
jgi:hypothetical protein